jgi:hypothetical protein
MLDDDLCQSTEIEGDLQRLAEETARMQRALDEIEAELSEVAALLLRHAPQSDLALDFLRCFGAPGQTLH